MFSRYVPEDSIREGAGVSSEELVLSRVNFALEAGAAGGFDHLNIVTVHLVSEATGISFLVMGHVDGTTLTHLIREHEPLPATMTRTSSILS